MIKIEILGIGRDKDKWVSEGSAHFEKLLGKYCRLSINYLNIKSKSGNLSPVEIKKSEAIEINKKINNYYAVALSDKGQQFNSHEFSHWLNETSLKKGQPLQFIIGGPYGLDDSILVQSDQVLSLSSLTFSHQLVRLVLLEQLYRGLSIMKGSKYHK